MGKENRKFYMLTILFALGACFLVVQLFQLDADVQAFFDEHSVDHSMEQRILKGKEWEYSDSEWTEKTNLLIQKSQEIQQTEQRIDYYSYGLLILAVAYLYLAFSMFKNQGRSYSKLTVATAVVALFFLVNGLFLPMIEPSSHVDDLKISFQINEAVMEKIGIPAFVVPTMKSFLSSSSLDYVFTGRTYMFCYRKSTVGILENLWEHKNYFVACMLVLFSIVIPISKLFLSALTLVKSSVRENKRLQWLIGYMGKWSMADVMVASVILVFMSFNNTAGSSFITESEVGIGLYFFMGFVIVSVLSSSILTKAIGEYTVQDDSQA